MLYTERERGDVEDEGNEKKNNCTTQFDGGKPIRASSEPRSNSALGSLQSVLSELKYFDFKASRPSEITDLYTKKYNDTSLFTACSCL